jgi:NAD+ diphosphatase
LRDPEASLVPVWQSRSLLRRDAGAWSAAFVEVTHELRLALPDSELVLLGLFHGKACFAAELPGPNPPAIPPGTAFEDLRLAGGQLPQDEAGLLAYARAMVLWRQRHRYCGRCGSATQSISAGHVMKCSNDACGAEHFPRLDPAIIVLVTDGERALLGGRPRGPRAATHDRGFRRAGEPEDAVGEVLGHGVTTEASSTRHSPGRSPPR